MTRSATLGAAATCVLGVGHRSIRMLPDRRSRCGSQTRAPGYSDRPSMAVLVLLNVFLLEAELLGRVEDEHLHADVGGHVASGQL